MSPGEKNLLESGLEFPMKEVLTCEWLFDFLTLYVKKNRTEGLK